MPAYYSTAAFRDVVLTYAAEKGLICVIGQNPSGSRVTLQLGFLGSIRFRGQDTTWQIGGTMYKKWSIDRISGAVKPLREHAEAILASMQ